MKKSWTFSPKTRNSLKSQETKRCFSFNEGVGCLIQASEIYNLFSGFSEDVVKSARRCFNVKMRVGDTCSYLLSSFIHEAFP